MSEDIKFKLGFDGTAFKRGVTSVRADMKKFASETAASWRQAFTFGAIFEGLKSISDRMIEIKRTSEDLGVSAGFLQTMQKMAVKFGSSSEAANGSLMKLAETMGQARLEGGEALEKFDKFGISLYDINGEAKTTEEVFKNIADRYGQATDAATKAALAFEFFGKQGRQINNILAEGSGGIEAYQKKLQSFGWVVSDKNMQALIDAREALKSNTTGPLASIAGFATRAAGIPFRALGALSAGKAGIFGAGPASDKAIIDSIFGREEKSGKGRPRSFTEEMERRERNRSVLARQTEEAEKRRLKDEKDALTIKEKTRDLVFEEADDSEKIRMLKLEILDLEDEANDRNKTQLERSQKQLEIHERMVQIAKIQKNIDKERAEIAKEQQDAIDQIDQGFKRDLEQAVLRARGLMVGAGETIRDKMSYTRQDFATANLRGILDPETRRQASIFQQKVMPLEAKAARQKQQGFFNEAIATQTQADLISASLDRLQGSEQIKQLLELQQVSAATKALAKCIVDGNKLNSKIAMAP